MRFRFTLLQTAFTATAIVILVLRYRLTRVNYRLEFFGDCIVKFIASVHLMASHLRKPESFLTGKKGMWPLSIADAFHFF
jgi:dsRNA-specific ribonuclease